LFRARPANLPGESNDGAMRSLSRAAMQRASFDDPAIANTPALWGVPKMGSPNGVRVTLSILMPAYNEEQTILRAIDEVLQTEYPCDIELIVVDDGSTDTTPELLACICDSRVTVFRHSTNLGKGAALRSAAALAKGTHILPFDADLEYSSEDIPRLLQPVLSGRCDVVFGARLFGFYTAYQSYRYSVGNRVLTRMANLLFDARLSDLHTCLKLMPLSLVRKLKLSQMGFGLDTELTALMLRDGIRPFEIPVSYYSRSHAQGKKIRWHDAVVCLWVLFKVRLSIRSHGNTVAELEAGSADGADTPETTEPGPNALGCADGPRTNNIDVNIAATSKAVL
jgi:dolichol-phosphate hexosyltransferase